MECSISEAPLVVLHPPAVFGELPALGGVAVELLPDGIVMRRRGVIFVEVLAETLGSIRISLRARSGFVKWRGEFEQIDGGVLHSRRCVPSAIIVRHQGITLRSHRAGRAYSKGANS